MIDNNIELRNIKSLSGLHFYIPAYQRGYRWSSTQALQLMKDFKEFVDKWRTSRLSPGQYYCLQPIVVKPKSWTVKKENGDLNVSGYEVIDGQQRLTTLYLLFKSFGKDLLGDFQTFTITYETRQGMSDQFLEHIDEDDRGAKDFVDFFYMDIVYKSMKNWIIKNKCAYPFSEILLNENIEKDEKGDWKDAANNIRIIWYELGNNEQSKEIDVFTRLNIGKIPLTNAELVKALLLCKSNFKYDGSIEDSKLIKKNIELKQLHISVEWNMIEQHLEDDALWYFIYNTSNPVKYETRIEYILDLMADKYGEDVSISEIAQDEDRGDYYTFDWFNVKMARLSEDPYKAESLWMEIKRYFQTIEYWYNDRVLFHLIGFLIETGYSISTLVEKAEHKTKKDFLAYVKEQIREMFKDMDIDTMSYKRGDNISMVLLLFNILTVLSSDRSDVKFSFDKYKSESWDREHIASQTDQEFPKDTKKRFDWLDDMIFYFTGMDTEGMDREEGNKLLIQATEKELLNQKEKNVDEQDSKLINILEQLVALKTKASEGISKTESTAFSSEFTDLYSDVNNYFKDNQLGDEEKDKLSNMALLNSSINRSYGNAFFPIKRAFIKDNDSKGVFVPIATKNVFMKYYSRKIDHMMVWTSADAHDYLEVIKSTLHEYLPSKEQEVDHAE